MHTNTIKNLAAKLLATSAIVALVAGAPATVDFDADLGGFSIKPGIALAKGGDDGSDGGGDGDSSGSGSDGDGGGDSDDDDDHDNSGPGSDGGGHDDDDDDDDDDDHDNSGPGSENSGRDDDHDDDDDDDDEDEDEDEDDESAEREFTLADGTKIEVSGDKIEVTYSDGWKEEIENGQYEMKDPAGNTVVERPATAADRSRLEAQIPG